jgi:hypothetical protein
MGIHNVEVGFTRVFISQSIIGHMFFFFFLGLSGGADRPLPSLALYDCVTALLGSFSSFVQSAIAEKMGRKKRAMLPAKTNHLRAPKKSLPSPTERTTKQSKK